MQMFSGLDLEDYVAMVFKNTTESPAAPAQLSMLGKIFGIGDTSGWSVYGDFVNDKTLMHDFVFLIPFDDAKTIGASMLTMKLEGKRFRHMPVWYCEHVEEYGVGIPEKIRNDLQGCKYYGKI